PALLWAWYWLSRKPRPPLRYTGSISLWRASSALSNRTRTRRGLPHRFSEWLALLLALLALAGPEWSGSTPPRRVRVVVDRSPSMYLPGEGGPTRLALGLASLRELEDLGAVDWVDGSTGITEQGGWPSAWDTAPGEALQEPRWERWDQPGTWWLTDHAPLASPLRAGWLATGGAEVPGPVALVEDQELVWLGGERWETRAAPHQELRGGAGWPEAWRRLAGLWAEARGLRFGGLDPLPQDVPGLELVAAPEGPGVPLVWEGPGFGVRGAYAPEALRGLAGLRPWLLAQGADAPLWLAWEPGRCHTSLTRLDAVTGDADALAVAWIRVFDQTRRMPAEIVPQSERISAQAGLQRPESGAALEQGLGGTSWASGLAVGSILCLLLGLNLRR
ncbi:MAG TPA: hypothetical protein PLJ12_14530, partial [Planctomycetota bacterium]|nr:hypothetical protein [Planctomycetota bacterium]